MYKASTSKDRIHRAVTWELMGYDHMAPVCGSHRSEPTSVMPSGYNCPDCLRITPGLQLRGQLEAALSNIDVLSVPECVRAGLQEIAAQLGIEQNPD